MPHSGLEELIVYLKVKLKMLKMYLHSEIFGQGSSEGVAGAVDKRRQGELRQSDAVQLTRFETNAQAVACCITHAAYTYRKVFKFSN